MRGIRFSALRQRACLAAMLATGTAALCAGATPATVVHAGANPDFAISLSTPPTLNPGGSATVTASVLPLNIETSAVDLVPSQGPALAAPAGVVVSAPYAPTTFTLSANAEVPPGTYSFSVSGVDGNGNVHSASLDYAVVPAVADFSVSATPSEISVAVGTTGSLIVAVTPSNGMHDDVQLSVAPAGVDANNARPPVLTWSNGTAVDDVSAPYAPQQLTAFVPPLTNAASYTYTVTATGLDSASLVRSVNVVIDVVPAVNGDFTIDISAGPTINPGTSGTFTATVTGAPGEVAPVVLTPVVQVGTVSPSSVVLFPPYGSVVLTISVNANVPPNANLLPGGAYLAEVAAVDSNGFARLGGTVYRLTQNAADFGLYAPSSQVTIAAGSTGSLVVQVPTGNGMNAAVDLAALPSGVNTNAPISPIALWSNGAPAKEVGPPYADQVLSFTVPAATAPGPYYVTVVGASGNGKPGVVTLGLVVIVD